METPLYAVQFSHGGLYLFVGSVTGTLAHCGSGGTADALASGASWSNPVGVQIPASAPLLVVPLNVNFRRSAPMDKDVCSSTSAVLGRCPRGGRHVGRRPQW